MSKRLLGGTTVGCKKDKTLFKEKILFLIFSVLVANPRELLYTVTNPAPSGLLNRENIIKRGSLTASIPPPPPHADRTEENTHTHTHR